MLNLSGRYGTEKNEVKNSCLEISKLFTKQQNRCFPFSETPATKSTQQNILNSKNWKKSRKKSSVLSWKQNCCFFECFEIPGILPVLCFDFWKYPEPANSLILVFLGEIPRTGSSSILIFEIPKTRNSLENQRTAQQW